MIFKNLFKKKKWLSEKVSDRLAAVAELTLDEPANKSIMHELAFNDANDKVRRAALDKLNDFSLWWQAYKQDSADTIKKHAEKLITQALMGEGSLPIDPALKAKFISECNNSKLLEKVVFAIEDEALVLDVLKRLDKENLYYKAITDSGLSADLKQQLIENTTNISQLKKFAKKLTNGPLNAVNNKIAQLTETAERPIKIEKQLRLILARLNALKDKNDFEAIQSQKNEISQEWQKEQEQFDLLPNMVRVELEQKFTAINHSLERILAPLKAEFEAQQSVLLAEQEMAENAEKISQKLDVIESQISTAISEDKEIEQEQLTAEINIVTKLCHELTLKEDKRVNLIKRCESIFNRANQVPLIKQAITNASAVIQSLVELKAPTDLVGLNEINPQFKAIKKQWQDITQKAELALPTDLSEQYKTALALIQEPVWQLEREQKQLFNQCRRKINELDGLVQRGRYHNAFGLHKKLSYWMADLNDYQQSQLEKKWQEVEAAVERLRDLEQSFSNPKKQELLADIQSLAENPIADPTEQAHRVRLLRSNWQSLGHAGDDKENELNQQFDELCEAAFAPCRAHYQALEKERNDNLAAKQLILTQLATLNDNLQTAQVANWREVESVFVKLTKLWRETGLIDREKVDEVNSQYRTLCAPIRKAINAHHSDNEAAKRDLLKQAEKIVAAEQDISEKIDLLKGLQSKWQKVGFAGKNADQKLWREFRAINNPVFAEREASFKQQKEAAQAIFEDFQDRLNELKERLGSSEEIADYRAVIDDVEAVVGSLSGLAKPQYEKLKRGANDIIKSAEQAIGELRTQHEKQVYVDLFNAVEALAKGESANTTSLKPAWQTALNTNGKSDRLETTLKIEILAGTESPESEKAQRNALQMALMSDKLEQGIEHNIQDMLETWLASGPIEPDDILLLERIKPIYLA